MTKTSKRALVFLATALAGAPALAADTHLAVPGQGWEIRFDGPAWEKGEEKNRPTQYVLNGTGGRFNLSYYVEPPSCAGGTSNDALYACYQDALRRNPMVVPKTVRANALAKGVAVMYMMEVESGGRKIALFNVNVLFAHGGKQGDLHVSYVAPQPEDIATLIKLAESFDIVDTAPAAK
jgi:hypothetical protein